MGESRVFVTKGFGRWSKGQDLTDVDLLAAINEADGGIVAAQLGGGLVKLRVARQGAGKSGGYRAIVAFKADDRSFYIEGFAKNDQDNLPTHLLNNLRIYGKLLQAQDEAGLDKLKAADAIREIERP